MKSVLSNSLEGVYLCRELVGNESVPPKPVKTRWGTFLNAASFLCYQHFESLEVFVLRLEGKALINDLELRYESAEISKLSEFPDLIEAFESREISMENQLMFLALFDQNSGGIFLNASWKYSAIAQIPTAWRHPW